MDMDKDETLKNYFEDNSRYADIINGIGCGGEQLVQATDLQEVDSGAGRKSRDMLRKAGFGANFALVGIENQENMDYELPLRCMRYDAFHYQKQANKIGKEVLQHQKDGGKLESGEFLYRFRRDSRLNPIITFVLYYGKEPWDGPTSLHDILDFSEIPDKLKNITPDYPANVIDIRRFENTKVFKTDVRYVFDFIRCSEDEDKLFDLISQNAYYKDMDIDAFNVIKKYTNSKELIGKKEYQAEGGKVDVCKAIRDLMASSREEGKEEGRAEGFNNGVEETFRNTIVKLRERFTNEEIAELLKEPLERIKAV